MRKISERMLALLLAGAVALGAAGTAAVLAVSDGGDGSGTVIAESGSVPGGADSAGESGSAAPAESSSASPEGTGGGSESAAPESPGDASMPAEPEGSGSTADPAVPEGSGSAPAPEEPDSTGSVSVPAVQGDAPDPGDSGTGNSQNEARDPQGVGDTVTSKLPEYTAPGPLGSISFYGIRDRMLSSNLTIRGLDNTILDLEELDYDELEDDLRDQLNDIADAQWELESAVSMFNIPTESFAGLTEQLKPLGQLGESVSGALTGFATAVSQGLQGVANLAIQPSIASLDQAYDQLKEQLDAIEDGELQADNEDIIRQLENTENTLIMAGETLYIALAQVLLTDGTVDRNLATLDRTLEELELRYELGQISALTLQEARSGRTTLLSSKQTLQVNIENLRMQMENLLGADLRGTIQTGAVPEVTLEQINAMNEESDLAKAKSISWELYSASKDLEDARETYNDAMDDYDEGEYEYRSARRAWETAQNTYQSTVQSFELGFRSLYSSVKDAKQVLDAARTALSVEKSQYRASQLKYEQGTISKNTLLSAEDDLKTAQDSVDTAVIDLFSAYNNYRWAVDYGIVNSGT